ncbi:hypothetical protein TYRP_014047 [Tyrophagus putrescentiae]|nr:hypothetical protein TYRP_014047 [Tyrophagus putrescentiae]
MPSKPLKIVFQSLDAAGHLSACYGLAQTLVARGHQVTFLLNDSFKGQAKKFGCREVIFESKPVSAEKEAAKKENKNPIKDIAKLLITTGMLGPKSSLEKIESMKDPTFMNQLVTTLIDRSEQIEKLINEEKPDLFILDLFLVLPVIQQNVPYVSIFSGNPLFLFKHPKIPPGCSGYRFDSDLSTWQEFKKEWAIYTKLFVKYQTKLNDHFNYVPKPNQTLVDLENDYGLSPTLNLIGFPKELDYFGEFVKLPNTFFRLDAFCRQDPKTFTIPQKVAEMPGKALIYFSLGSMGGMDVDLMKKILSILGKTKHRYIVSKGVRSDEFDLPTNCWGEAYLPQTAILPLVDLVITHGGNNSFTESFSFGKKMIVLPLNLVKLSFEILNDFFGPAPNGK